MQGCKLEWIEQDDKSNIKSSVMVGGVLLSVSQSGLDYFFGAISSIDKYCFLVRGFDDPHFGPTRRTLHEAAQDAEKLAFRVLKELVDAAQSILDEHGVT